MMEGELLQPAVITANAILVWIVQGLCFGLGFSVVWLLVNVPARRWWP